MRYERLTRFIVRRSIECVIGVVVLAPTALRAAPAPADYPIKPIRMIVGFAPGGATDVTARALAAKLSQALGKQVIVDNRPGASGNLAAELLVRAEPDGYTTMLAVTSLTTTTSMELNGVKPPFDINRDFAAISSAVEFPNVVVVHPSLPVNSVRELIAIAKAKPGHIAFGSSGVGGFTHLSTELFNSMAGVSMTHVPYKGGGPSMVDLIAGRIQVVFATSSTVVPHLAVKKVRALAVTTASRSALLPELPTIVESGLPGYEATNWSGLFAPARTPVTVVNRLNAEVAKALRLADLREFLFSQGQTVSAAASPEQFSRYVKAEAAKWGRVIKSAGIKAE